jgi:hypothetical protein
MITPHYTDSVQLPPGLRFYARLANTLIPHLSIHYSQSELIPSSLLPHLQWVSMQSLSHLYLLNHWVDCLEGLGDTDVHITSSPWQLTSHQLATN